jgi:hypothetical protein
MSSENEIVEKYAKDDVLTCTVRCPNCPSLIFCPEGASLHKLTFKLPNFAKDGEAEQIHFWWKVDDMFKFENIGFRKL